MPTRKTTKPELSADLYPVALSRGADVDPFHRHLKELLPRLRRYAFSLTHDPDIADDVLQEAVTKALRGRHSFQPGTNMEAWLFRIVRNEFINTIRKARKTVSLEYADEMPLAPQQESGIVMREFLKAFSQLDAAQREALVLAVLDGKKLDDIAAITGVRTGTIKSRICRARDKLALLLFDEPRHTAVTKRKETSRSRKVPHQSSVSILPIA